MKEFYQNEMDESQEDNDKSFNSADDTLLTQRRTSEGSRGVKQAPEQKTKDKVWESIMNQANQEAGDSSSDE